ncbi:protein-tyrosine phosphatase-like protein [Gongronella butleri]|nr:protein-tyrosine phosphatase-like protein [Gongronella butleri]
MALGAHSLGNLAMSSCPGKKVRLTGPVRGRAAINRDLELDFARMRSFGITTLVCCLEDSELDYLGASWPKYSAIAVQQGLHVLRLPMIEGSCPNTLEEVDAVIEVVNGKIRRGENVLTHCRGGVGRAGLFACCWLIHNTFCLSAERAVRYVRIRRSPKAIETMRQAEFVIHYAQHIARRHQRQLQQHMTHAPPPPSAPRPLETMPPSPATFSLSSPTATSATSPLELLHTDYTLSVPPVIDIINLERIIRQRPRPSSPGHISL